MKIKNWKLKIRKSKGIASLGMTLILGAVIIEIALAIAVFAYVLNFSNLGIRFSEEALLAAKSGIDDGFLRVLRHDYPASSYIFSVGSAKADVEVSELGPNELKITSIGSIFTKKRKLTAMVSLDSVSRRMKVESIIEMPL